MAWDWRVDADMGGSLGTVDLAPWMREWTLFAGKNTGSSFGSYGIPAVLEVQLENEDGRFSRTNPGSPYAMRLNGGGLVDMHIPGSGRLIRARLAPFTAESSQGRSLAKLTAHGALRELQTSEGVFAPLEETRTDLIVQRILRAAGIDNRHIYLSDGTRTMPYFWAERGRNFDIALGPTMFEGGALLDHRNYGVLFEPRNWRTTSPNDEIRARLGGSTGYRVASFDDSGEFDVVINTATVPYHSYVPGAVGTLYEWSGALLIPAYGFLLAQDDGYLLQQDGGKFIVQAPVEQEFRVEISSDTPSAVDWSMCVLTVTASVGDISSECRLVGRSPTEAIISVPRRDATYTVTAIRVTGPIIARDVSGQEPFRDPISIADLGGEYAPEVVPSWHDDRLEARQLAVDMVIGFKSQGLVAKVGFWLRGRAESAWRRWISEAVAVDLVTREGVRIESNGVIEQLRLHQRIGSDPYGEWTLSGLYRELPDSTTVVMAPINDVNLIAGTQLAATLPEAMGGSGSFSYILTGAPGWVSRTGFMLGGTAPATIGSDTLTWSATDTSSGTTISRSFRVARTGIMLVMTNVTVTSPSTSSIRVSWGAVANATRYEYRRAQGSAAPTGAWTSAGTATSVTVTGLSRNTQYTVQVRAVGTAEYITSTPRQGSATTRNLATTVFQISQREPFTSEQGGDRQEAYSIPITGGSWTEIAERQPVGSNLVLISSGTFDGDRWIVVESRRAALGGNRFGNPEYHLSTVSTANRTLALTSLGKFEGVRPIAIRDDGNVYFTRSVDPVSRTGYQSLNRVTPGVLDSNGVHLITAVGNLPSSAGRGYDGSLFNDITFHKGHLFGVVSENDDDDDMRVGVWRIPIDALANTSRRFYDSRFLGRGDPGGAYGLADAGEYIVLATRWGGSFGRRRRMQLNRLTYDENNDSFTENSIGGTITVPAADWVRRLSGFIAQ